MIGSRICAPAGDLARKGDGKGETEGDGETEREREIHVRRAWSPEISGYAGVIDVEDARE